jgi:flagellin-specific chaperone FliS
METAVKSTTRTQRINSLISVLKKEQPEALEEELKRLYLLLKAQKLDNAVIKNNISMEEIVEEVNIVRRKKYEETQHRL